MKTAARIWLIAALTECILYAFIFREAASIPVVGIIALLGGFPGMLALAFGLELVNVIWETGVKKWVAICIMTLIAANGTLSLFLLVMNAGFTNLGLPCFEIVNIAATLGLLCSIPYIRKQYFTPEPQPTDVTHHSPYQFKQEYDQN